jgi:protein-disulfide isomerase
VRYEYKNFAFISEATILAAEAALCAADQGQFWPYHDTIFANQGTIFDQDTNSRRALKQIAKTLGLDTQAFNQCFNGGEHRQDVQRETSDGNAKGIDSTPTVFVNDVNLGYPTAFKDIQQVIEEELAKADVGGQ